jgi:o-succinylbenzoate synthase
MKLTRVRVTRYRLPFREPYVTAAGSATHREGFIVRVETDAGITGLGEGSLLPHVTQSGDALGAMIRGVATRLLADGIDAFLKDDQDEALDTDPLSWAPLSIAAWDLAAKRRDLPLAYLLTPGATHQASVNALVGGGPANAVALATRRARETGHRTVKLKVGMAATIAEERERVAAARTELLPPLRLRIDANGAWNEEQAIETLKELIAYDLEYVEQPVPPGNPASLARVRHLVPVRVAADEDVTDRASAQRVLQADAADVLVLKPLQAGGIGQLCIIAGEAAKSMVDVTITTSIDTGVGTAAALHLAAARGGRAHGLATLPLLEDDLIADPGLPVEDGVMRLPEASGLGVEIDAAALARYTVDEWEVKA